MPEQAPDVVLAFVLVAVAPASIYARAVSRQRTLALVLVLLASACGHHRPQPIPPPPLPVDEACLSDGTAWQDKNGEVLRRFVSELDTTTRPVAVFDWDNTMIKNDVGAAVVYYVIRRGMARRPDSWDDVPYLTPAARRRLAAACPGTGEFLPSERPTGCAKELVSLYERRTLSDGTPAFAGYNFHTYKPSAAWQVHLLAGYTPAQVRAMARKAIDRACRAEVGSNLCVGGMTVPGYVRVYRQMAALLRGMRRRGFDVWVVSASPQNVVEVFAHWVGIKRGNVIGIRSVLDGQGRITRDLQGCGAVKDGHNSMITYREGKRCWIKKIIGRPVVFAAGDSVTDVEFLQDAKTLRLVVDRGYEELMCHAKNGSGPGRWLINPMFIDPRPRRGAPYPCSSTACKDASGAPGPCRHQGKVLSDR